MLFQTYCYLAMRAPVENDVELLWDVSSLG